MSSIENFLNSISNQQNVDEFTHDPDEPFGDYEPADIFPREHFCWKMIGVTEFMMDYLDGFFGALITEDLADADQIEDWCETYAELFDNVEFVAYIRHILASGQYDILTASKVRPALVDKYPVLVGIHHEGFWQALVYLALPPQEGG